MTAHDLDPNSREMLVKQREVAAAQRGGGEKQHEGKLAIIISDGQNVLRFK